MKTENDTYKVLKRIPLDEMESLVDINNFRAMVPPTYRLGSSLHDASEYYRRDLEIQSWRNKNLEKNGWTFEEFVIELEKRAIMLQVAEFNKENQIPHEIISRAKVYFPNVKFAHAKVELE